VGAQPDRTRGRCATIETTFESQLMEQILTCPPPASVADGNARTPGTGSRLLTTRLDCFSICIFPIFSRRGSGTANCSPIPDQGHPCDRYSADATPCHISRLIACGANDYLTKPIDFGSFFLRLLERPCNKARSLASRKDSFCMRQEIIRIAHFLMHRRSAAECDLLAKF